MELMHWSFLVAATGKAMIDVLPQLEGGCINYWEAGNWALNDDAEPKGLKTAREYRKVHLHLLGRSPAARDPAWRWGEAPKFPDYVDRHSWASKNERLNPEECSHVVAQVETILQTHYEMHVGQLESWFNCRRCGYPTPVGGEPQGVCGDCHDT
ncbi:MAG: hypothetical protein ACJ741_10415 [Pyrinomonadaceae bacterium]